MAQETHRITAPIGVEAVEAEAYGGERGLRIIAWAEEAWPDYVAVDDRITGRIRVYGLNKGCAGPVMRAGIAELAEQAARLRELKGAIVRCRDCNHGRDGGNSCRLFGTYEPVGDGSYDLVPHPVDPCGFCAWGVSRDQPERGAAARLLDDMEQFEGDGHGEG